LIYYFERELINWTSCSYFFHSSHSAFSFPLTFDPTFSIPVIFWSPSLDRVFVHAQVELFCSNEKQINRIAKEWLMLGCEHSLLNDCGALLRTQAI